jgi:DNA-binding transcriptional regulator GbsR (MarR family)
VTAAASGAATGPAPWQATFVEQVASLAEVSGLPPSYIQVLGWLVVCDPPEQSVGQLQQALALSTGAVSMATTSLIRMGLAERTSQPGQRRHYYRFRPGGWERMLRLRAEATSHMRAIAETALAAAPQAPPRLTEMRNVYAWFESAIAGLLEDQPWRPGS